MAAAVEAAAVAAPRQLRIAGSVRGQKTWRRLPELASCRAAHGLQRGMPHDPVTGGSLGTAGRGTHGAAPCGPCVSGRGGNG